MDNLSHVIIHSEAPAKPEESEEVDFGIKLKKRKESEPEVQAEVKKPELTHLEFDEKTDKPAFQRHEVEDLEFDFKPLDLSTRERSPTEIVETKRKASVKEPVTEEVVEESYVRPEKAPAPDETDAGIELKLGKGKVGRHVD